MRTATPARRRGAKSDTALLHCDRVPRTGHPSFQHLEHRPWPLPDSPHSWRQTWCDLLFAHWPIAASRVRALIPAALEVDEFDGTSWIGVVPFRMEGVTRRGWPDLPGVSAFPELNLRLYVTHEGKAGVWFLSLDAASRLAVWTARRLFHLPYHHARMTCEDRGHAIDYRSRRTGREPVEFRARYGPAGDVYRSTPGSLEHWLTERYCLYTDTRGGRLLRAEVHHPPWPLQKAEAHIERNDLLTPHGLKVEGAALLHFARRLEVAVWSPRRLSR